MKNVHQNDGDRLELRARDPVAQCLIRHLMVPDVYFDKPVGTSHGSISADVVAIDRAGSGDVHVVEIKHSLPDVAPLVAQLMEIPAAFRWLACFKGHSPKALAPASRDKYLFPQAGMGRIGLIEIVRMADDTFGANIVVRAERFAGPRNADLVRALQQSAPDIAP